MVGGFLLIAWRNFVEIHGVGGEFKTYSVHYQQNVILARAATLRMYSNKLLDLIYMYSNKLIDLVYMYSNKLLDLIYMYSNKLLDLIYMYSNKLLDLVYMYSNK